MIHILEVFKLMGVIAIDNKDANNAIDSSTKKAQTAGSKMSSAFSKIGTAAKALGVAAVAAGAALATVTLKKGWDRMVEIDNAKVKLEAIGLTAAQVTNVMESATSAVKGTAFGLDEAATVAASAVAAGIEPGEQLTRYLGLTADAASVAGRSMSDMGSIFNKVQTSQAAYTEELNQLADSGIPIYQWLGEEAGLSAAEVKKAASISAEMFQNAVEKHIGGAAKTIGSKTISGAIKNLGAAIGRIGANFLGSADDANSFAGKVLPLLNDVTSSLGTVENGAKVLGAKFGEVFSGIIDRVKEIGTYFDRIRQYMTDHAGELYDTFVEPFMRAIPEIMRILSDLWNNVLQPLFSQIGDLFAGLFENLDAVKPIIENIIQAITAAIGIVVVLLETIVMPIISNLVSFIQENMDSILGVIEGVLGIISNLLGFWLAVFRGDWDGAWEHMKGYFESIWNLIVNALKLYFNTIMNMVSTVFDWIKSFVQTILNTIADFVRGRFDNMKSIISTCLQAIQNIWSSVWNGIRNATSNILSGIQNTFSNVFNSIKNTVSNIFNGIRSTISSVMENAKNIIANAISFIRSKFNFTWSLPHLKLPHFNISGSFSLNPPSVPHFSIAWYKKAMDKGLIMNTPTIFGVNPATNTLLAGGEAGSETVVGTESLMSMIGNAVHTQNEKLTLQVSQLIDMLSEYFADSLREQEKPIVLSTGETVTALTPYLDAEFGNLNKLRGRGF